MVGNGFPRKLACGAEPFIGTPGRLCVLENRQYSSNAQIALRLPASVGKMPRWITGESVLCIMGRVLRYVNSLNTFGAKMLFQCDLPLFVPRLQHGIFSFDA
jgi:hypothetical protein